MKFIHQEYLIRRGPFADSDEWIRTQEQIKIAIEAIVWPSGNSQFIIFPEKGKGRQKGNGVKPIKMGFIEVLRRDYGWIPEEPLDIATRRKPGNLDAVRYLNAGPFAVEWETGNVSSSHRALNKMLLGMLKGVLIGGVLVVPTRELYQYLTDRVGNYEELTPYFDLWKGFQIKNGVLAIMAVEHHGTSLEVPKIMKGTDGRALV